MTSKTTLTNRFLFLNWLPATSFSPARGGGSCRDRRKKRYFDSTLAKGEEGKEGGPKNEKRLPPFLISPRLASVKRDTIFQFTPEKEQATDNKEKNVQAVTRQLSLNHSRGPDTTHPRDPSPLPYSPSYTPGFLCTFTSHTHPPLVIPNSLSIQRGRGEGGGGNENAA